jgi:hypothetical protein
MLLKYIHLYFKYVGQTGKTFKRRYEVHVQAIRNNNRNSGYSKHVLDAGHTYGPITDTVDVIRTGSKGRHLAP